MKARVMHRGKECAAKVIERTADGIVAHVWGRGKGGRPTLGKTPHRFRMADVVSLDADPGKGRKRNGAEEAKEPRKRNPAKTRKRTPAKAEEPPKEPRKRNPAKAEAPKQPRKKAADATPKKERVKVPIKAIEAAKGGYAVLACDAGGKVVSVHHAPSLAEAWGAATSGAITGVTHVVGRVDFAVENNGRAEDRSVALPVRDLKRYGRVLLNCTGGGELTGVHHLVGEIGTAQDVARAMPARKVVGLTAIKMHGRR